MSTVLVSLAVMVVAIVSVMAIVFSQSDQPATLRRRSRRDRPPHTSVESSEPPRGRRREPEPTGRPDFVLPALSGSGAPDETWVPVAPVGPWDRLRSGLTLVLVLSVVGTLLAIAIGTAVVVAGLNLRDALQGPP